MGGSHLLNCPNLYLFTPVDGSFHTLSQIQLPQCVGLGIMVYPEGRGKKIRGKPEKDSRIGKEGGGGKIKGRRGREEEDRGGKDEKVDRGERRE